MDQIVAARPNVYQVMPPLADEDFASLKADIARRGVQVAVEYDELGNILDGHHRVRACRELGMTDWPRLIRQGMTESEKRVHARQLNIARRHLDRQQKRELIADQLRETPGKSDRQIAVGLKVSPTTAGTVRAELESTVQIGQLEKTIGKDGKARSKPRKNTYIDNSEAGVAGAKDRAREIRKEERAAHGRHKDDNYPTPDSIVAEIVRRWKPRSKVIWEPCAGDGRVAKAWRGVGYGVITGDLAQGQDFFACDRAPCSAMGTNPPFERVREFIDHAFAIGVEEMCLVLPERFWASGVGRELFERHRPSQWVNLDWREDYLGKGGAPDRALAVAIWDGECAAACAFDVWTREGTSGAISPPAVATSAA